MWKKASDEKQLKLLLFIAYKFSIKTKIKRQRTQHAKHEHGNGNGIEREKKEPGSEHTYHCEWSQVQWKYAFKSFGPRIELNGTALTLHIHIGNTHSNRR